MQFFDRGQAGVCKFVMQCPGCNSKDVNYTDEILRDVVTRGIVDTDLQLDLPIKDFIPILPGRYKPHDTWRQTLAAREEALRNRHMKTHERWSEHTKQLPLLGVGDFVRIQNQIGHHPKKWDKTGTVIEVRQFNQYM